MAIEFFPNFGIRKKRHQQQVMASAQHYLAYSQQKGLETLIAQVAEELPSEIAPLWAKSSLTAIVILDNNEPLIKSDIVDKYVIGDFVTAILTIGQIEKAANIDEPQKKPLELVTIAHASKLADSHSRMQLSGKLQFPLPPMDRESFQAYCQDAFLGAQLTAGNPNQVVVDATSENSQQLDLQIQKMRNLRLNHKPQSRPYSPQQETFYYKMIGSNLLKSIQKEKV